MHLQRPTANSIQHATAKSMEILSNFAARDEALYARVRAKQPSERVRALIRLRDAQKRQIEEDLDTMDANDHVEARLLQPLRRKIGEDASMRKKRFKSFHERGGKRPAKGRRCMDGGKENDKIYTPNAQHSEQAEGKSAINNNNNNIIIIIIVIISIILILIYLF
jgi:hypothetical protein